MRPTRIRDTKMKKTFFKFWLFLALGFSVALFNSCETGGNELDEDGNGNGNQNTENPFEGTWKRSPVTTPVTITLTKNTWTLNASSVSMNGTYTYQGNTAQLKVTGGVFIGDTGNATISDNKMTVSNSKNAALNGQYTKRQEGEDNPTNDLIGTWLCSYAKTDCGGGNSEEFTESQGITWTFKSDGTVSLRNVNGDTMSMPYTYKDGVITISTLSYNVISLTSSSLILQRKGVCSEDWTFKRQ